MICGDCGTPKMGPGLVGEFWGLDSDRILKLVLGKIILTQEIEMPPSSRRPMGNGLQQLLPFGRIIELGEFLRQKSGPACAAGVSAIRVDPRAAARDR
jgi:hypothetical protein